VFADDEDIQQSEGGHDGNKETARQDCPCVIPEEGRPALITTGLTWWSLRPVLPNRAWRDPDAQLDQ